MRCRPLATEGGASICMTRSMAPMSMPSSSDEVATSAAQLAGLEQSSISVRCARASDPWCARTSGSPASSLSAAASRSARRRLFTKSSVERWARISSSSRGWIELQIDGAGGPLGRWPARLLDRHVEPCHVLDRDFDRERQLLRLARIDDGDGPRTAGRARRVAREFLVQSRARRVARPSPGAAVACARGRPAALRRVAALRPAEEPRDLVERPLRRRQTDPLRAAACASCSSRSSDSARCAPRLVGTSAWISSMITVSTDRSALARVRGQQQEQRLGRGDQDVGGLRAESAPVRRPACRPCAPRRQVR